MNYFTFNITTIRYISPIKIRGKINKVYNDWESEKYVRSTSHWINECTNLSGKMQLMKKVNAFNYNQH